MDIKELKNAYKEDSRTITICHHFQEGTSNKVHIKGSCCSADAFIVSAVYNELKGHHICILPNKEAAVYFLNDLESLNPDAKVYFYTNTYAKLYGKEANDDSSNALYRSEVLNGINTGRKKMLVVTYPEPLMEKVATEARIEDNTFNVEINDVISLEKLRTQLFELNFESENYVYEPGQFAIRGGIIDIFSFSEKHPYRIELFGDKIDSIRTFDPATQLSVNKVEKLTILSDLRIDEQEGEMISLFDLIQPETKIWIKDAELVLDTVDNKFEALIETVEANKKLKFDP
ncbi:MAG: transcription-repair coupling factor, partial [Flavobacteriales bacterium]|nr:transcription-repair coupling factor [Flavobacteriales bacterium]